MSWTLFLDDERNPPECADRCKTVVIRSGEEAIAYIRCHGLPEEMDLDGYLGVGMHGKQFLFWLAEHHLEEAKKIEIRCHSSDFETRRGMMIYAMDMFGR